MPATLQELHGVMSDVPPTASTLSRSVSDYTTPDIENLPQVSPSLSLREGDKQSTPPSYLGSVLCLIGVLFFSFTQLCAYLASSRYSASEITLVRSAIQTVGATLFALVIGVNPIGPSGLRLMCFIRGFIGALANLLLLYAVAHMPMADANAIFFTNPIFTTVYASLILKQRVSVLELFALCIGLVGSLLVARPTFIFATENETVIGDPDPGVLLINIFGAALAGAVPVIVSFIGSSVHYVCLVFSFGACGALESAATLGLGLDTRDAPAAVGSSTMGYVFLVGTGLFGMLSQFFYNKSLQLEKPQNCAILFQTNVALTFLWQALVNVDELSSLSVVGSLLIVCSSSAILGGRVVTSRSASSVMSEPKVERIEISITASQLKE
ncbi:hypothetical protein FOL47_000152 [Perkinsus chesapeaki]|uniref:EamA domain-containing protein n=1 Tax=Perkinsus chesapeaki TaxID=330153 RepID=A0A7J6MMC5_PERCH|nr:hypothetical protein FOL47_000152 [Perkinsus chesapeaki]